MVISIHALREEGDAGWRGQSDRQRQISIHALREEGDLQGFQHPHIPERFLSTPSARRATSIALPQWFWIAQFLSTPSARRATSEIQRTLAVDNISIHALREEGDRNGHRHYRHYQISIHALREEGDLERSAYLPYALEFLSTPSARRATAKTETKSLFSYKLYNILHEFRRALIYNGSKNDPNHAK